MKKEAIAFLSLIFLLPLVSAQFTISEVASFIDPQTVFLLIVFGLLGLLFKKGLDRFPVLRGTMAGIISVLASILATYGINKWFTVNDLFLNLGISGDFVAYLPLVLLIVFIINLFVFRWKAFFILGLLLILITLFTDLVAEKTIVLVVGIVLVAISLIWKFGGRKLSPRLITEAKAFRQFADKQTSPKMYRNWAYFLSYLKKRGYGRNEQEICMRMGVMPKDIQKAVKRYIK